LTIDEAIHDLLDVSTDIRSVAIVDENGAVVASAPGPTGTEAAAAIERLWDAADRRAGQFGDAGLEHVVVPVPGGAVAVASAHGRCAAAVTGPTPAVALLLFDLRTALDDAFAGQEGVQ
jgi:predicted regulator of Ras-like GTPase activity (Roadblock/LC7/MglB family)